MKVFLTILAVGLVAAEVPISTDYHADFGIAAAARIKAAEEATDFDGSSRIAGGSAVGLGVYPHMGGLVIPLTSGFTSVCGSSLLTHTRLVTAAHCWHTSGSQAIHFVVVLGSTTLFTGGIRITTTDIDLHANYNTINLNNDIAMIRISWVPFSNHVNKINLPIDQASNTFAGVWANAAGFGRKGDNVGNPNTQYLSHVSLQVITNAVCQQTFGSVVVVPSTLCISGANGRSTCTGDSGGPLSIGSGLAQTLIGVTSFGGVFCENGLPAGFARITYYLDWIQQRLD